MTLSTVDLDTFVIERTYTVPVAQVFHAWSDPKLKARWFAGSVDALDAGYELDFRVGGREVNRGGPPGGPVYTYESQFRDIVPEERIIYTYEMYAGENRISVSVATVQFHSEGATTRLVLTEQGVFLDGHDTAAQREEGTRSLLESLAAFLHGDVATAPSVGPVRPEGSREAIG
jgi:uncharacterized protein YndB with AHSA1/START domain